MAFSIRLLPMAKRPSTRSRTRVDHMLCRWLSALPVVRVGGTSGNDSRPRSRRVCPQPSASRQRQQNWPWVIFRLHLVGQRDRRLILIALKIHAPGQIIRRDHRLLQRRCLAFASIDRPEGIATGESHLLSEMIYATTSQICRSLRLGQAGIAVPRTPCRMAAKVRTAWVGSDHGGCLRSAGGGTTPSFRRPRPSPFLPWQMAQ